MEFGCDPDQPGAGHHKRVGQRDSQALPAQDPKQYGRPEQIVIDRGETNGEAIPSRNMAEPLKHSMT